jgi:oligopeptide transport system permease protein
LFRYIIRRFLGMIPTLFVIITLSFFIIKVAPGGPFSADRQPSAQILENLNKKYHLDEPWFSQYFRYMGDVAFKFDLGPSFKYPDHDVNFFIFTNLPNSLILGLAALFLSLLFGLWAGILSALKQNSFADYGAMSLAVIGISIPLFVIGPVLQLIFSMWLGWLPTAGWITEAGWTALLMPALTLAFPHFAYIARLSRASILEIMRTDYVRTARAKGLKESVVIMKPVMKGALLPVVSFMGPAFAGIITGSVVIETIFGIPGLGRFFVQSALNRDYLLIMGTVVIYSVILIVMNFLVDIVYSLLDPRVAYK